MSSKIGTNLGGIAVRTTSNWIQTVREIGPRMAERAAQIDHSGEFVTENYGLLKEARVMSAAIPAELGGGGATHAELCDLLRELAHYCSSTALALSMHSHLVAAAVWKYKQGNGGEALLQRIAKDQTVLLSTGGSDWVDSSGEMTRVEGGYRVNARKIFGSGSPAAEIAITSSRYQHPEHGWQVLHFPLSMRAEGVRVLDDWDSYGMRGTGSNSVLYENVFVPDEAIVLTRPAGRWHPVWSMVVVVAFPVFLAPYLGVAEKACELARQEGKKKASQGVDAHMTLIFGEMENHLATARMAWEDMMRRTNDYEFENSVHLASQTLIGKTLMARSCVDATRKAMEATGGKGYHRAFPLERLLRDVSAIAYHPLTEKRQEEFTGRLALGLDPITAEPLDGTKLPA